MKTVILFSLTILLIVATFYSIISMKQKVDLIIFNATIYTVDKNNSVAEAVAIRGSRFIAIGTSQDIQKRYSSQNIINANDKTIIPGMIDAHAHVLGLGESLRELNLVGTISAEQIVQFVADKVKNTKSGEWIRGRGWDQNNWGSKSGEKAFPNAALLDKISPNNPVVLSRIDGHALWVNSKAMEIAGIKENTTREIEGGKILRDGKKNPNGIFIDNAGEIIQSIIPEYSALEKSEMYERAFKECVSYGLTGVHDMGINQSDFDIYKHFAEQQKLPLRIYGAVGGNNSLWKSIKKNGVYEDRMNHLFSVRALKLYEDGALGSRGAALIEPYSDEPENQGLEVTSKDSLRLFIEEALANGFQVCVHAIGDRGNKNALDAYEEASKKSPSKAKELRMRIEHAQVLDRIDIPRFKKMNIIPSMQPTHCTSDMYWAQARLGPERVRGAYSWRWLLDDGNIIASGSDFPVEHPNPLLGFYAAITRQDKNGIPQSAEDVRTKFQLSADGIKDSSNFINGWYPKQKMTREEALRSFTIWAAYAEFAETEKGSIESGKLADFVLLSHDIMKIQPKDILTTTVETTVVGGKVRYNKSPK